jgi:hypothetical protein
MGMMVLTFMGYRWAHVLITIAFIIAAFGMGSVFSRIEALEHALWFFYLLGCGLALWLPSVRVFLASQRAGRG